jgi:hypothetical protein
MIGIPQLTIPHGVGDLFLIASAQVFTWPRFFVVFLQILGAME